MGEGIWAPVVHHCAGAYNFLRYPSPPCFAPGLPASLAQSDSIHPLARDRKFHCPLGLYSVIGLSFVLLWAKLPFNMYCTNLPLSTLARRPTTPNIHQPQDTGMLSSVPRACRSSARISGSSRAGSPCRHRLPSATLYGWDSPATAAWLGIPHGPARVLHVAPRRAGSGHLCRGLAVAKAISVPGV